MRSPGFYQKRLQDLADNIAKDQELLKDFEDELRYTIDPRLKARYRREIVRQSESVARYRSQYAELQQELTGQPSAQMQEVGIQLRQMDAKLNVLLSGKVPIYEDLLPRRFDRCIAMVIVLLTYVCVWLVLAYKLVLLGIWFFRLIVVECFKVQESLNN